MSDNLESQSKGMKSVQIFAKVFQIDMTCVKHYYQLKLGCVFLTLMGSDLVLKLCMRVSVGFEHHSPFAPHSFVFVFSTSLS